MNLEELGRNPPDVTLDHVVKDLLSFFDGFECLHEAKRQIENQCDINKEPEHKCWSEDHIKQAWEETVKKKKKSGKRKHWARVIVLQIVKSFICDTCKQNTALKSRHDASDEQEMRRNPEDTVIQSNAEPETDGAAGGDQQVFAGKTASELSGPSADEAPSPPSPPEVNSSSSETKKPALNENKDTSVNNCAPSLADVLDKEDAGRENDLRLASQSVKGNSDDRSAHSSDEPQKTEQTTDTAAQPSAADFTEAEHQSTDNTGAEEVMGDDGNCAEKTNHSQTVYIRLKNCKESLSE